MRIDCDVLLADGGTRTTAITGAYVALHAALAGLVANGTLESLPLRESIAAVSCGIVDGEALCDLDYEEDSIAEADGNFVLTGSGEIVEIQCTAEKFPICQSQFMELYQLATQGIAELSAWQRQALEPRSPSA